MKKTFAFVMSAVLVTCAQACREKQEPAGPLNLAQPPVAKVEPAPAVQPPPVPAAPVNPAPAPVASAPAPAVAQPVAPTPQSAPVAPRTVSIKDKKSLMMGAPQGGGSGPIATKNRPALIGLKDMSAALKAYKAKNKGFPDDLQKLVEEGFLPHIPVAPVDMEFFIDKSAVEVKLVKK